MNTEASVPLEDIGARFRFGMLPAAVKAAAERMGITPKLDWAGRNCVTPADAKRIYEGIVNVGEENARLQSDFQKYQDTWLHQQRDAGEAAFQVQLKQEFEHQLLAKPSSDYASITGHLAQPVGPAVYARANERAAQARDEFEKKQPRIDFDAFEQRWRKAKR